MPIPPRQQVVRLSINLHPKVADTLKRGAAIDGVSVTEAIRRAIGLWRLVQDAHLKGERVVIRGRRGEADRELILLGLGDGEDPGA